MKKTTTDILDHLLVRRPVLTSCADGITKSVEMIIESYTNGHKLMVCGNGGSAADSLHMVGELMKAVLLPRTLRPDEQKRINEVCVNAAYINKNLQGALPTISLVSETSLMTAYANDMAPDLVFAQQVFGYGHKGDVLFAISTSGNSKNILYASEVARAQEIPVIALTGESGGKLKSLADVLINVPETETTRIQELHLPVYHAICLALENEFFGEE